MNCFRSAALLAACLTTLLAAGCGSSSKNTTTTTTTTTGSETSTAATSSEFPDLKGQNIVYTNFGGEVLVAAKQAWLNPFSEKTGLKIATDSPSDAAKVKAMVDAGRPTWSIIDTDTGTGAYYCGKLFVKRGPDIDISKIDKKFITDECGVPIMVQSIALIYNKKKYADNPPTKITDFMDTSRFPGKRSLFNYPVGGFEPLLAADGVAPDKIYPIDYARTASVFKRLGSNLVLQSTTAQQSQQLESGNFDMCLCYTARAAKAAEKGATDIGIVWNSATIGWDGLYMIKGAKYPEAQRALLNYIATPEAQAAFTEAFPYGPTTPSAKPNVPEAFKPFLPNLHESEIGAPVMMDGAWWAANIDAATAKWTAMTAG